MMFHFVGGEVADFIGRAKLFWHGRSQAIRLPRACRFAGDEVEVRREGDAVIVTPASAARWPRGYFERLGQVTDNFGAPEVQGNG